MNIADLIEKIILGKLSGQRENIIILKRNELADELSCAPSQISYVLNTRFTMQRGFIVESRRGLGGYIRIVRLPVEDNVNKTPSLVRDEVSVAFAIELIEELRQHEVVTLRESAMIKYFIELTFGHFWPSDRARIVKALLVKMAGIL